MKRVFIVAVLILFGLSGSAYADGHKIDGKVSNFTGTSAYLAMLYGGNQYIVDTAVVSNGSFQFNSYYKLQPGVYLVVLPPTRSFLVLVDESPEEFSFTADYNDLENTLTFTNSPDNTNYYEYIRFFRQEKEHMDKVKKDYEAAGEQADRLELLANMQAMKDDVVKYQRALVDKIPGTLTAAIVKCELLPEVPQFEGTPEQMQMQKYLFYKEHFFDNVDLADERLIRAPSNVLVDKVDYYMDQLTPQQPDSLIGSVDYILKKCEPTPASYRFFLTHLFNKYRDSKTIGMDAIYVHIAEDYIAKGKADWIEDDAKAEIMSAIKNISPTLIGKKAPDFVVQLQNGESIHLYDVKSPYTVLFFWAPNCTHCQQSMPMLKTFYETYKSQGVQILAVCTKINEQEPACWDYLEKNSYLGWMNASDKTGGSSLIHSQYNIRTTPKIYVLDEDKKILVKDIGVENLDEVMKRLLPGNSNDANHQ